MTSISNITDIPRDIIALIGEFSENFAFLPAVSEKFKEKGFIEESEKITQLAAERIRGCLSNINEIPNDAIALIGEFSGNLDFLPAVSKELYHNVDTMHKAYKVNKLAEDLAPKIAKVSLLADEEEVNKIADVKEKSVALKDLVEKYTIIVMEHNSMLAAYLDEVALVSTEIHRIVRTIPDENLQREAECITDRKGLAWRSF
ncbi:MAG: hypothetical protein PVI40_06880 [Chlamydiota bacterium]